MKKLFPNQVGFTSPPYDFDAAPSDFLRICPDTVGVHGWMMHDPEYKHELGQRKKNFSGKLNRENTSFLSKKTLKRAFVEN